MQVMADDRDPTDIDAWFHGLSHGRVVSVGRSVHLAWAIVFVGAVAFEVIVLESPHKHLDIVIMQRIEQTVMARVRTYMPVVVIPPFVSGFMPSDIRGDGFACVGSRSSNWLLFKVVLAPMIGIVGLAETTFYS